MTDDPLVCAVMLYADRPQFLKRAIDSFRSQTYKNKRLFIYDNSVKAPPKVALGDGEFLLEVDPLLYTIGEMRNRANAQAVKLWQPEIFMHWDSDDWSHPCRIADQVELLRVSEPVHFPRIQCVGYRDMLFWRALAPHYLPVPPGGPEDYRHVTGEAWLYSNKDTRYAVGTSLCYFRSAWERNPFKALPKLGTPGSEDTHFIREVPTIGVNSIWVTGPKAPAPRMIASIHGGNSSVAYKPETWPPDVERWKRVESWDEKVRAIMEAR